MQRVYIHTVCAFTLCAGGSRTEKVIHLHMLMTVNFARAHPSKPSEDRYQSTPTEKTTLAADTGAAGVTFSRESTTSAAQSRYQAVASAAAASSLSSRD